MVIKLFQLFNFVSFLVALSGAKTSYDGAAVLRVVLDDEAQVWNYRSVSESFGNDVNEWSETDMFVPNSDKLKEISRKLDGLGLTYKVMINDVGGLLKDVKARNEQYERRTRAKRSAENSVTGDDVVGKYATYDEIKLWLEKTAESNKEIMSARPIGRTFEDRELIIVTLGTYSKHHRKPAFWIDFGIHAREWISTASGVYIINKLVRGWNENDENIVKLLEDVDFYLLPVTNPDGYVYSHEVDRMWRKNRSPDYNNTGCRGTDLNRNFGFEWGGVGSSANQCSVVFRGPRPESEPETLAIDDAVRAISRDLQVYLTVHSYSQLWMNGWAYDDKETENNDEEITLAMNATAAIFATSGKLYQVGASPSLLYKYTGGSPDWAKGVAGVKYSFCVELRDQGEYGFLLPADQIEETGEELFSAVRTVGHYIAQEARKDPHFNQPNNAKN